LFKDSKFLVIWIYVPDLIYVPLFFLKLISLITLELHGARIAYLSGFTTVRLCAFLALWHGHSANTLQSQICDIGLLQHNEITIIVNFETMLLCNHTVE